MIFSTSCLADGAASRPIAVADAGDDVVTSVFGGGEVEYEEMSIFGDTDCGAVSSSTCSFGDDLW